VSPERLCVLARVRYALLERAVDAQLYSTPATAGEVWHGDDVNRIVHAAADGRIIVMRSRVQHDGPELVSVVEITALPPGVTLAPGD
jgi:hypothetical protein